MPEGIPLIVVFTLVLDETVDRTTGGRESKIVTVALPVKGIEDDLDDVVGAIEQIALHGLGPNAGAARGIVTPHRDVEVVAFIGEPEFGAFGRRGAFAGIDL